MSDAGRCPNLYPPVVETEAICEGFTTDAVFVVAAELVTTACDEEEEEDDTVDEDDFEVLVVFEVVTAAA